MITHFLIFICQKF